MGIGSRKRKSEFQVFVAKALKLLRDSGELKVRSGENPADPDRQKMWKRHQQEITKRYEKIEGKHRWQPSTVPTVHFLELPVRSPEEEVAALEDRIFPYDGASCFWPYLLSTGLRPTRGAAEIAGFGTDKIVCPSWLSSITRTKLETKISQLFKREDDATVESNLKDLWTLFEVNSSAVIAYLNLRFEDDRYLRVRLAQFHLIFSRQISATVGDAGYTLVSNEMAPEITRLLIKREDAREEYFRTDKQPESEEPLGDAEEVICGLADIVAFEFDNYDIQIDFENLATNKSTTSDLSLVVKRHREFQAHLLKSLSKKNSTKKVLCPFHRETATDQVCCTLAGEADELRKTLRNSDGRLKLLEQSRRNGSRLIRFLGPTPRFLRR